MTPPIPKERREELRRKGEFGRLWREAVPMNADELLALLDAADELESSLRAQSDALYLRGRDERIRAAALEEGAKAAHRIWFDGGHPETIPDAIRALKEKK